MIKRFFAHEAVAWIFMITCMVLAIVFGWKQKPKMVNDKSGMLTQDTIDEITKKTNMWSELYGIDYAFYIAENDTKLAKRAQKEASKLKLGKHALMIAISLADGDVCFGNSDDFFSIEGRFKDELSDYYWSDDTEGINEKILNIVKSIGSNMDSKADDSAGEGEAKSKKSGSDTFAEGIAAFGESAASTVTGIVDWGLGLAGKILSKLAKLGFWGIVIVFIIISSIFGKKK